MFFTARVTVFSAANAAEDADKPSANTVEIRSLFMGTFRSCVEEQWRQEIETEGGNDQDCRHHEHDLDQPVRQRAGTGFALDAGAFRGAMDEPVADSEKRDRRREEVRL